MGLHILEREQVLPITMEQAWEFFASPAGLHEISPADRGIEITSAPEPAMYAGRIIINRVRIARYVWPSGKWVVIAWRAA